jgi:hypothetical protein
VAPAAEYQFWPSANCRWYAFQPGHQVVCQRQRRAINELGFSSARRRIGHVSHEASVFFISLIFLSYWANAEVFPIIIQKATFVKARDQLIHLVF